MFTLLKATFLFTFLIKAKAHPLASDSLTTEWSANLGLQTPGITPLFTRLNDTLAVASILQNNSTGQFELNVRTYESHSGVEKGTCRLSVMFVKDRVWETRLTGLGESRVIVSWMYNDKVKTEGGIRLVLVDLVTCQSKEIEMVLYENVNFVYYVSHSIIPYRNGSFELFVKSPMLCNEGICRIRFDNEGERVTQHNEAASFLISDNDSHTWSMVRLKVPDDSSECFYHLASGTDHTRITQLASNGTQLGFVEVDTKTEDEVLTWSGGHGNLGFCFGNSTASNVTCLLFDSALNKKIEVVLNVCNDCKGYVVPLKRITMANTKDGGFVLLTTSCVNKLCDKHVTNVRKIEKNGNISEAIEFLKSKDGCFPRNNYDVFEIGNGSVYCSGFPCMRKPNVNKKVYEVSIHARCLKSM